MFDKKKFFTYLLKILKMFVFFTFVYTSLVMYKLNNPTTSLIILFAAVIFLILNKLENLT